MISNLFQSSTIPMLQQVVNFAQARHNVLAGNIANLDTPGYQVRDLSVEDFQERLQAAVQARRHPETTRSLGFSTKEEEATPMAEVAKHSKAILYHDLSNVDIEEQVTAMVKNQMQHNLALTIMNSQFRLLKAAIRGQA